MGARSLNLVTDATLSSKVQRRPSAANPLRDEMAINTTFAEAAMMAFRTLDPARTTLDMVVVLVIAAMPPAYRTATTYEVETALRFWEVKGQISLDGFKQLVAA